MEPNARFLWTVSPAQSVWGAISRAVRTPALTEENMRLNSATIPPGISPASGPLPILVAVFGSSQFRSENLLAYELGYRIHPTSSFSANVAAFYNNYDNLLSAEPGTPFLEANPAPIHIVAPFLAGNKMSGGTYGTELFADWRVLHKWKLSGSYSYLQMNIHKDKDSLDPTSDNANGTSPHHQLYLRSSIDLPKNLEQDLMIRYVDRLPGLHVPSYYSLDARLGWRPVAGLELSVSGQNLLNDRHLEFVPDFINTSPTEVKRTLYGTITWRF